jgi:glycosyltransferase involved in cell wall biosynthesis
MPILSVIVPVYNIQNYLQQCLDSILSQTFKDFELILVNDGSTDGSGLICDSYSKLDSRVLVIHQTNQGLSCARNNGIKIASGHYLSFIDGDDFISQDYFSVMDFMVKNPLCDMAVLQVCHFTENDEYLVANRKHIITNTKEIMMFLFSSEYIGTAWINIYSKRVFSDIRFPEGRIFEDGYILSDIASIVKIIYVSDSGVYYYRKREGSIMQRIKSVLEYHDILNTHAKQLEFILNKLGSNEIFVSKFEKCHYSVIEAIKAYPSENFSIYLEKLESKNISLFHLLFARFSIKTKIKILLINILGYVKFVKLFKKFLR